MKCIYYLAPTLDSTHTISDDLHAVGVKDWYIHVASKDEAGLQKEKIHSSNYLETSDALSGALTGAIIGLLFGVLAALFLMVSPFGSGFVYAIVVLAPAVFGLWVGAMLRSSYDGKKIDAFHDDLEAGKYLFLIYTPESMDDVVRKMMQEKHPESEHVAVDEHFLAPLRPVQHK